VKLIKNGEGVEYNAPGHLNCFVMNKLVFGGKDTKNINIGMSYFLPGGGAEMGAAPVERVYYVVSGSIEVKGKNEKYLLTDGDLIYIGDGEEREFKVLGNFPATIIVVAAKPV